MAIEDERKVWFVDRYGDYFEGEEATIECFIELLKTIQVYDGDDEHRSISVDDSDGWNLEFYPDWISFCNVEPGGKDLGQLHDVPFSDCVKIVELFRANNFVALEALPWRK